MNYAWLCLISFAIATIGSLIASYRLNRKGRWVVSTVLNLAACALAYFRIQTDLAHGLWLVCAVNGGILLGEIPTLRSIQ